MDLGPFALLELPGGRWCVAKVAASAPGSPSPVGIYATRDEAERAIDRAAPTSRSPLSPFATWLRRG